MDRKEFLVKASLAAFAVSACGTVKPIQPESEATPNRFTGDCETTNDILGPFYRPQAPMRSDMIFSGLEGSRVQIKGTVYGPDCQTELKDALVEIWHCDTEGTYDNNSDDFRHRARQKTSKKGEYAFNTILPGKYLNGALYRPAHIHFRITAPGHKELVSQIYFQGDPHIEKDPWASKKKAEKRVLPIVLEDTKGNLAVTFDIYLAKAS